MMKQLIALVLLSTSIAAAGQTQKQFELVMPDVTARGRMLYEYDEAAWHGTDAVYALHPSKESFQRYIAHKESGKWTVVFGMLNEKRDGFVVVYQAEANNVQEFIARKLKPPAVDTGFYLAAAKSVDTVLQDFHGENRPYNVAIFPTVSDELYVYVYPAQTKENLYPFGGDVRYLISADGKTIKEKRQLHVGILDREPPAKNIVMGVHTHVLSDVPEDTDVFYVLAQRPSIPECIVTRNKKLYIINTDGTIHEGQLEEPDGK